MSNFVYDNLPLNNAKVNRSPIPAGEDPNRWVQAAQDWNPAMNASLDLRGAILSNQFLGIQQQVGEPTVPVGGAPDFLWLDNTGTLWAKINGVNNNLLAGGGGGITGTLSAGFVPYALNPSTIDDSGMFWDDTNGRLGLGTTTPGVFPGPVLVDGTIAHFKHTTNHTLVLIETSTGANIDAGLLLFTSTVGEDAGIFLDESDQRKLKVSVGLVSSDADRTTSTKMTFQQNGYVGIGTTSPLRTLHVVNGGDGEDVMRLRSTAANGFSSVNFENNVGTFCGGIGHDNTAGVNYSDSQTFDFVFSANSSEMFRFVADGTMQFNGSAGAVSDANTGRIRYNSGLQRFEQSSNSVAYAALGGSSSTLNQTYVAGASSGDQTLLINPTDGGPVIYKSNAPGTGALLDVQTSTGATIMSLTDNATHTFIAYSTGTDNYLFNIDSMANNDDWTFGNQNNTYNVMQMKFTTDTPPTFGVFGTDIRFGDNATWVNLKSGIGFYMYNLGNGNSPNSKALVVDTTFGGWTDPASRLLSLRNGGTERIGVDGNGTLYGPGDFMVWNGVTQQAYLALYSGGGAVLAAAANLILLAVSGVEAQSNEADGSTSVLNTNTSISWSVGNLAEFKTFNSTRYAFRANGELYIYESTGTTSGGLRYNGTIMQSSDDGGGTWKSLAGTFASIYTNTPADNLVPVNSTGGPVIYQAAAPATGLVLEVTNSSSVALAQFYDDDNGAYIAGDVTNAGTNMAVRIDSLQALLGQTRPMLAIQRQGTSEWHFWHSTDAGGTAVLSPQLASAYIWGNGTIEINATQGGPGKMTLSATDAALFADNVTLAASVTCTAQSSVADGPAALVLLVNSNATLSDPAARLLSLQNNGVTQLDVLASGTLQGPNSGTIAFNQVSFALVIDAAASTVAICPTNNGLLAFGNTNLSVTHDVSSWLGSTAGYFQNLAQLSNVFKNDNAGSPAPSLVADTTYATAGTNPVMQVANNGTVEFEVHGDGVPRWVNATNVQTTVGAAGGASALPATPTKYLRIRDDTGTDYIVPAYNP